MPAWNHRNPPYPDITLVTYGRDTYNCSEIEATLDAVVDCESLHKLFEDKLSSACSGESGRVMLWTVTHPEFYNLVSDAKKQIGNLMDTEPEGPKSPKSKRARRVGMRCRHGKHRSRAATHMIRHCLELDGLAVGIWHSHSRTCGCPKKCCANRDLMNEFMEDGAAALKVAERYWRMLG